MKFPLTLGISARHLHLKREDMDVLFGAGSELHMKKPITQPGQYASEEQVILKTAKTQIKLRVLGPIRPYTQIELSMTDARSIGIKAPIRNSGDVAGSAGDAELIGPKGTLKLKEGIIIAARHIHLCPATAEKYGLKDGDWVDIETTGERAVTFHHVLVRAGTSHADECHIDTDEGNACNLKTDDVITVVVR